MTTNKKQKRCMVCNKKISEGYTWEDETNFVCSENCLKATGLTDSEINSDINAGVVYWTDCSDSTSDYLNEKIALLEKNNKVIFEHKQIVYEVFLRSDGDYEYNCYDLKNFVNGDILEANDGGVCTGSAKDAIEMAIEE